PELHQSHIVGTSHRLDASHSKSHVPDRYEQPRRLTFIPSGSASVTGLRPPNVCRTELSDSKERCALLFWRQPTWPSSWLRCWLFPPETSCAGAFGTLCQLRSLPWLSPSASGRQHEYSQSLARSVFFSQPQYLLPSESPIR